MQRITFSVFFFLTLYLNSVENTRNEENCNVIPQSCNFDMHVAAASLFWQLYERKVKKRSGYKSFWKSYDVGRKRFCSKTKKHERNIFAVRSLITNKLKWEVKSS